MSNTITIVASDGSVYQNETKLILPAGIRAATTTTGNFKNKLHRGLHLVINVTSVPGVDTVTPKIQGYNPNTGLWYTLLTGTAISTTGINVLKIYPGISASANASASDFLPEIWNLVMTHSAGTNFDYSVVANLQI
jgi:hypothetical protein